jgi:hypothetical protein
LSAAIVVRGARNVLLDNVFIRGFGRGIVLENSSAVLNRVTVSQSGIGLVARRSHAVVNQSAFIGNKIDILAENASLELIDTIVKNLLSYLSNIRVAHYAVNQYMLTAQAREILRERNPAAKRRKFRQLLKTLLQYASYVKTVYDIVKLILRTAGVQLPS